MLSTEFLLAPKRNGERSNKVAGQPEMWRSEYFWPPICNMRIGDVLASPRKDMYVYLCAVLKLFLVPFVFGQT